MEADEFEAGSVFNSGSKKQNINHLLNFQFEPRGNKNAQGKHHHGGGYGGWGHHREKIARPKYKKEQYLQAK